jgi:hypothetical protein
MIRRIGYRPLEIRLETIPDTAFRIVLPSLARDLEAVRVTTDRVRSLAIRGFYERAADVERGINRGFFVTPEELEARSGARLTDFFNGHPGIRVKWVKESTSRGRWGPLLWTFCMQRASIVLRDGDSGGLVYVTTLCCSTPPIPRPAGVSSQSDEPYFTPMYYSPMSLVLGSLGYKYFVAW